MWGQDIEVKLNLRVYALQLDRIGGFPGTGYSEEILAYMSILSINGEEVPLNLDRCIFSDLNFAAAFRGTSCFPQVGFQRHYL
jgi:hypothetical protein